MKKVILTIGVVLVLLLTGASTIISIKTVNIKEIETTAKINEKPMDVSKPVENKYMRYCFFFADIDSSGYANKAVIRCYDGILSVTYYDGVTTINAPFKNKTFIGAHKVEIYGFGGTKSWAGSVTNKDLAFAGFIMFCFVQPL